MRADFFTQLIPTSQNQTTLDAIIERIQDGKVVPIVGGMFVNDLAFGNHDALVRGWAGYIQYAQADRQHDLARLAQYAGVQQAGGGRRDDVRVKEEYLKFLKAALQLLAQHDTNLTVAVREEVADQERELTVSQLARFFGYPSLASSQENALLFLAALPLPVYITTSYHDFLEVALREKAGKDPQT
ncbi:MAG TPA: hypothetical protein PKE45_18445, partial [Caldilineaceae bacterium]|nr:hypothetical protein [Caldilineaceae bacterium]